MNKSIALLEVQSLVAAIGAVDIMLKSADVNLIHIERSLGGRLVSVVIDGDLSSVTAALKFGIQTAKIIGKVKSFYIIPNPHKEILKFIYTD